VKPSRWLLTLATLVLACHRDGPEETKTEASVPVQVARPRVGTITAYLRATGSVDPAPGADWLVSAPQPARIALLHVAAGDAVRRGELLVRFDAPALRSDLATRDGELTQSQARLENAGRNHARLSELEAKGIASRKQVEDAERELQEAQAGAKAAGQTQAAVVDLAGRATVSAPFDGVVVQRWHNPGDLVDANEHVLRLVDPRRLEVTAAVAVADLGRIRVGRPAHVRIDASRAEPASVAGMPGAVDAATGTASVRLTLSKPLPIGSTVQVEIAAEQAENAIVVPAAAVVGGADKGPGGVSKAALFVVTAAKKAQRREVEIGLQSGDEVQILSGLEAEEDVVVKGNEALPDGAAITIEKVGQGEPVE
jgi:RND family efflux transporter MFP subunit